MTTETNPVADRKGLKSLVRDALTKKKETIATLETENNRLRNELATAQALLGEDEELLGLIQEFLGPEIAAVMEEREKAAEAERKKAEEEAKKTEATKPTDSDGKDTPPAETKPDESAS